MKLSGVVAIVLWSLLCAGQQVHVTREKTGVVLSVVAQKPYQLMSGEFKEAKLSVECIVKGKKTEHMVNFSPGGSVVDNNPEAIAKTGAPAFTMTIGGTRQVTTWAPSGDTVSFNFLGKNEPERLQFIQTLLNSGSVSIEFVPFLTGAPTSSVFDLSKLREEMAKYPECSPK